METANKNTKSESKNILKESSSKISGKEITEQKVNEVNEVNEKVNKVNEVNEKVNKVNEVNEKVKDDSETKEKVEIDDKVYIDAFQAIKDFVNELWEIYNSNKPSALALYRRLIAHIKDNEIDSMKKVISGFTNFFLRYEEIVINDKLDDMGKNTKIAFNSSKTVFLDIKMFIDKADEASKQAIRSHLLKISTILSPTKEKLSELEKEMGGMGLDNTAEGEFIGGIVNKAKNVMDNIDTSSPLNAIMGMVQSGVVQDMVSGLNSGVNSGKMSMDGLLNTMHKAIGGMMKQPATSENTKTKKSKKNKK